MTVQCGGVQWMLLSVVRYLPLFPYCAIWHADGGTEW